MNSGKNAPTITNTRYQTKNATVMGKAKDRWVRRSSMNSSDCCAARNCVAVGTGAVGSLDDMGPPGCVGRISVRQITVMTTTL